MRGPRLRLKVGEQGELREAHRRKITQKGYESPMPAGDRAERAASWSRGYGSVRSAHNVGGV